VLSALARESLPDAFEAIWAVGDDVDDLPMLRLADRAFLTGPRAAGLAHQLEGAIVLEHFGELVSRIPETAIAA